MTREERNRYNRAWQRARKRRIFHLLGNECVECGATEKLQLDHKINKGKRVATIWQRAWSVVEKELPKLQLLCEPCHIAKTRAEVKQRNLRIDPGSIIMGGHDH